MLVVGVVPEQLVFDNRAASREAVEFAQILGLEREGAEGVATRAVGRGRGVGHQRREGCPLALTVKEVDLAVQLIGAALGYGGDDTACRAAILGRVHTGVYRKLAHGVFRGRVRLACTPALLREVRLVVVRAVDLDVVQQRADTAHADQAEAVRVRDHARGQHRQA